MFQRIRILYMSKNYFYYLLYFLKTQNFANLNYEEKISQKEIQKKRKLNTALSED